MAAKPYCHTWRVSCHQMELTGRMDDINDIP